MRHLITCCFCTKTHLQFHLPGFLHELVIKYNLIFTKDINKHNIFKLIKHTQSQSVVIQTVMRHGGKKQIKH